MTPEEVRVLRGVRRRSRPPPRTPAGASERRDRGRGGPRTRLSFRPKILPLQKKGGKIPQKEPSINIPGRLLTPFQSTPDAIGPSFWQSDKYSTIPEYS